MELKTEIQKQNSEAANMPLKKDNKKAFFLILAVVIVAAVVMLYFLFFSSKKDEEAKLSEKNAEVTKTENAKEEVDKNVDSDEDQLPDYIELMLGTAVDKSDSDGDGYNDLIEIKNGYNPLTNEKYTAGEWDAVKKKIKEADNGFYENVFTPSQTSIEKISSIPGIIFSKEGGCDEFPEKIGNYTRFSVGAIPDDSDAPAGIKSGNVVSYNSSNVVSFLVFESNDSADGYYAKLKSEGYTDCKISGIDGICKYNKSQIVNATLGDFEGNFAWMENAAVMAIKNMSTDISLSQADVLEADSNEKLGLFAEQLKICKVEQAEQK